MPRVTVADLVARLDAMQEEIDALRAYVESPPPTIQYVQEISPRKKISDPLDFSELNQKLVEAHSYYSEEDDVWGYGSYL